MEVAPIEENLIKQAKRAGQEIPERIKNKPILNTGLALFYNSFLDLQDERNESQKIPWSIIVKYAEFYEFSREQTEALIYFTRQLNKSYLKWYKNRG